MPSAVRPFIKNLFNVRLGVGVKLKQNYNCIAAVVVVVLLLLLYARSGHDSALFVAPNTSRLLSEHKKHFVVCGAATDLWPFLLDWFGLVWCSVLGANFVASTLNI